MDASVGDNLIPSSKQVTVQPTYPAYLAGESADPAHPVLLCLEQEKHPVLP
jgi:hypothetical protein